MRRRTGRGDAAECLLSSAVATVSASPARDVVRLRSATPPAPRPPSRSAPAARQQGRAEARRRPEALRREPASAPDRAAQRRADGKVVAAKDFTVELHAVNTPRYCHRYFDRHLTVKRASGAGLTWSEPAARSSSGA